jgi:hypothetical protein
LARPFKCRYCLVLYSYVKNLAQASSSVVHEGNVPCLLDRALDLPLVRGAVPGALPRKNAPLARTELLKGQDVLVVDSSHLLPAKAAAAPLGDLTVAPGAPPTHFLGIIAEGGVIARTGPRGPVRSQAPGRPSHAPSIIFSQVCHPRILKDLPAPETRARQRGGHWFHGFDVSTASRPRKGSRPPAKRKIVHAKSLV